MAVVAVAAAGYATSTAVATYVGTTLAYGAIAGAVAGAIAGAVVSSVVSGALVDDPATPDFGSDGSDGGASAAAGMLINKQANDAPIPVVYGQRKVGGTRILLEVTGTDNEYLNIVLAVSEGEIDSFEISI